MLIFQGMQVSYLHDFTMINTENKELMMTMFVNGVCLYATIHKFPNLSKYKYKENAVKVLPKIKCYWAIFGILHNKVRGIDWTTHTVVITGCGITPMIRENFGGLKIARVKNG